MTSLELERVAIMEIDETSESKLVDVVDVLRPIWTTTKRFKSVADVEAVDSVEQKPPFVHPKLRVVKQDPSARIVLVSAPGAVGKTTFARFATFDKKGFLWDLARIKIGDNTFIGTLAKKFGARKLSEVLQAFYQGDLVFFFDAFDEAEIISGWDGIESFVKDVCENSAGSTHPNVVFFSRTETVGLLRLLLEELECKYAMFEIDYFDRAGAVQFIETYLRNKGDTSFQSHREPFERAIDNIFSAVSHGMNGHTENYWDVEDVRSFIGYSPVLQTIGSYLYEENFEEIANKFEDQKSVAGGLSVISEFIESLLLREQKKVVDALKERLESIPSDWNKWDDIYTPSLQLSYLVSYLQDDRRMHGVDYSTIPDWLRQDYKECIEGFISNHPFLRGAQFSSPAFRDYLLGRLLMESQHEGKCKKYLDKGNFVPTPLLAYFYLKFGKGRCIGPHVGIIYEAASSKRSIGSVELVTFVRHSQTQKHIFEILNPDGLSSLNLSFEVDVSDAWPVVFERRLQNATVNVDGPVVIGRPDGSVELSDVDIKAVKLTIKAKECIFNCHDGSGISMQARSFEQTDYSLILKMKGSGRIEINWPDGKSHPWAEYYADMPHNEDFDFQEELYALKRILEPFRKHKKRQFAKQYEFIDNMIVSTNQLRKDMLNYLQSQKIIRKNEATNQYLVDEGELNSRGINWMALRFLSAESNSALHNFLMDFRSFLGASTNTP